MSRSGLYIKFSDKGRHDASEKAHIRLWEALIMFQKRPISGSVTDAGVMGKTLYICLSLTFLKKKKPLAS